MRFAVVKDGVVTDLKRSTKQQCFAEILIREWCVVETQGAFTIKGVEIREIDENAKILPLKKNYAIG